MFNSPPPKKNNKKNFEFIISLSTETFPIEQILLLIILYHEKPSCGTSWADKMSLNGSIFYCKKISPFVISDRYNITSYVRWHFLTAIKIIHSF